MHPVNETRGQLSRRRLIKRVAVAGTVAWTTPLIIESLVQPAGAITPGVCVPYWTKLQLGGGCNNNLPGSGPGRVCGVSTGSVSYDITGTKCGSSCTAGCTGGGNAALTPGIGLNGGGYYEITLTSGSFFSSAQDWALGGRYDTSSSLSNSSYTKLCAGSMNTGDGSFIDGGNKGYVKSSVTFGSTTKQLQYVYVRFCRSS